MKQQSHHVRVLTVTDTHRQTHLTAQLVAAVNKHRPGDTGTYVVACVGDFLNADLEPEGKLIGEAEAAAILAALPCDDVVLIRGNHEDEGWDKFQAAWLKTGRPLHALHGTAAAFGPLVIVGFPCFTGNDEWYGKGRELPDYDPNKWLRTILNRMGAPARVLWLAHETPSNRLATKFFWEPSWKNAVEDWKPLLVVSGHDHLTPLETGRFSARIGKTLCYNLGQRTYEKPNGKLIYGVIDFWFPGDKPCFPTRFSVKRYA